MTGLAVVLGTRTFRSLRRHHNYRLFFAGQIVSLAGSWMQNVALAWLVLDLSRSPLAVGALVLCRFAPYTVLGLFAGVIVDRFDTRKLVMAMQAGAMAVSVALAVVTLAHLATLPLVYLLAGLGGLTLVLDAPGRQTLTYELVGRRELPNAVALNSSLLNAARVVGPAVAGLVIVWMGVGGCFVINAVSFLAVLAALASMRSEELHTVAKNSSSGLWEATWQGVRGAAALPRTRRVICVIGVMSLAGFNFNTVVPLLAADTLQLDGRSFGFLSAAFGLGALVGALGAATVRRPGWPAFAGGVLLFSALLLILGFVHDVWAAGILLTGLGAAFTLVTASASTLVQLDSPPELRARVVSVYLFAFIGLAPIGGILSGWLAQVGGAKLAFGVTGATGLMALYWSKLGGTSSPHWNNPPPIGLECPLASRGKAKLYGRRL